MTEAISAAEAARIDRVMRAAARLSMTVKAAANETFDALPRLVRANLFFRASTALPLVAFNLVRPKVITNG